MLSSFPPASKQLLSNSRIAVVGGSMGGAAVAIALEGLASSITVFDRSETFDGHGHAIGLPVPMVEKLKESQFVSSNYQYPNVVGRKWYVKDDHHHLAAGDDDGLGREVWNQQVPLTLHHWGRLHDQLRSRIVDNLHLNVVVDETKITINDDNDTDDDSGGGVQLRDDNGQDLGTFDLVVAADGVNSGIRSLIAPNKNPIFAGYVTWRASFPLERMIDAPGIETFLNLTSNDKDVVILTAVFKGGQLLGYRMPNLEGDNNNNKPYFNIVMFGPPPPSVTFEGGKGYRTIPSEARQFLYDIAETNLPPFFQHAIRATEDDLWLHPVVDESPSTIIHPSNRLLLLGDAAATLRPHTASGTVKAFQDALCLQELALGRANNGSSDSSSSSSTLTLQDLCQKYDRQRVTEARNLVELGKHLGSAQIVNPPDWASMTEQDYAEFWQAMVSGTNFAYKTTKP